MAKNYKPSAEMKQLHKTALKDELKPTGEFANKGTEK